MYKFKKVIYSDESEFNLFGSDGRQIVCIKPNTEYDEKHIAPTVKYGGGSVIILGCISWYGVGKLVIINGIIDSNYYKRILVENLFESADMMRFSEP